MSEPTRTVTITYRNDEGEQIAYAVDLTDAALADLISTADDLAEGAE